MDWVAFLNLYTKENQIKAGYYVYMFYGSNLADQKLGNRLQKGVK